MRRRPGRSPQPSTELIALPKPLADFEKGQGGMVGQRRDMLGNVKEIF
jgi:hypothetical protein